MVDSDANLKSTIALTAMKKASASGSNSYGKRTSWKREEEKEEG